MANHPPGPAARAGRRLTLDFLGGRIGVTAERNMPGIFAEHDPPTFPGCCGIHSTSGWQKAGSWSTIFGRFAARANTSGAACAAVDRALLACGPAVATENRIR